MRILLAPDKWKACLTAPEAASALAEGLRAVFPQASFRSLPIADGGEGTARAVHGAAGGRWITSTVEDPMGAPVEAGYALLPDGTAVLEMASASGLALLGTRPKNPWLASTYGTGQLVRHALAQGASRIVLGIGGSATNDGGSGLARALGWEFHGCERVPRDLAHLARLDGSRAVLPRECLAACDVTNTLLGPRGCTRVFGPQKGVREEDFDRFENALRHLADIAARDTASDARDLPGAGAAGGLGYGLVTFAGAKLVSGFIGLEQAVAEADLVVTGEGSVDGQTLDGKGPHGVAQLAKRFGKPVVAVGGRVSPEARDAFDLALAATPPGMPLEEAVPKARALIASILLANADRLRALV
jgi:glycerate kinase